MESPQRAAQIAVQSHSHSHRSGKVKVNAKGGKAASKAQRSAASSWAQLSSSDAEEMSKSGSAKRSGNAQGTAQGAPQEQVSPSRSWSRPRTAGSGTSNSEQSGTERSHKTFTTLNAQDTQDTSEPARDEEESTTSSDAETQQSPLQAQKRKLRAQFYQPPPEPLSAEEKKICFSPEDLQADSSLTLESVASIKTAGVPRQDDRGVPMGRHNRGVGRLGARVHSQGGEPRDMGPLEPMHYIMVPVPPPRNGQASNLIRDNFRAEYQRVLRKERSREGSQSGDPQSGGQPLEDVSESKGASGPSPQVQVHARATGGFAPPQAVQVVPQGQQAPLGYAHMNQSNYAFRGMGSPMTQQTPLKSTPEFQQRLQLYNKHIDMLTQIQLDGEAQAEAARQRQRVLQQQLIELQQKIQRNLGSVQEATAAVNPLPMSSSSLTSLLVPPAEQWLANVSLTDSANNLLGQQTPYPLFTPATAPYTPTAPQNLQRQAPQPQRGVQMPMYNPPSAAPRPQAQNNYVFSNSMASLSSLPFDNIPDVDEQVVVHNGFSEPVARPTHQPASQTSQAQTSMWKPSYPAFAASQPAFVPRGGPMNYFATASSQMMSAATSMDDTLSRRGYSYPLPTRPPYCVWLGNVPSVANEQSVQMFFKQNLNVVTKDVRFGRRQGAHTCCYVDFHNLQDMKTALLTIDSGSPPPFMGRILDIDINEGIRVDRASAVTAVRNAPSKNKPSKYNPMRRRNLHVRQTQGGAQYYNPRHWG